MSTPQPACAISPCTYRNAARAYDPDHALFTARIRGPVGSGETREPRRARCRSGRALRTSKINISRDVSIDTNSRFVVANNAILNIGPGCRIGPYSIFNCGEDISIGRDCIFGGYCYFQSSNHGIKKGELIKNQTHTYGKISIGEGVWIGAHVKILAGTFIGDGAVIGANAVVTKNIPSNAIAVGTPARVISYRS